MTHSVKTRHFDRIKESQWVCAHQMSLAHTRCLSVTPFVLSNINIICVVVWLLLLVI